MPSPAANKFKQLSDRSILILRANRAPLSRDEFQAIYGAAFVAQVAAWNAYVVTLVDCFFLTVSNPNDPPFQALHGIAHGASKTHTNRFNTPNSEKTREMLVLCTGYDPWPDWNFPARSMNSMAVQARLNEIMKVRHSLAHGFPTPGFNWMQAPSGVTRFTLETVKWTRGFFDHLVRSTDRGLAAHLKSVFNINLEW